MGYRLGSSISPKRRSQAAELYHQASSIMGLMMVGAMSAACEVPPPPLKPPSPGSPLYCGDPRQIRRVIPLLLVLGCLRKLNKKVSPIRC
ncbi:MAG: hypothetical protein ACLR17_10330 [Enterobacteriaceae bacterium]